MLWIDPPRGGSRPSLAFGKAAFPKIRRHGGLAEPGDPPTRVESYWGWGRNLERGRQTGALVDGALCIQFSRHIGAPNDVARHPLGL